MNIHRVGWTLILIPFPLILILAVIAAATGWSSQSPTFEITALSTVGLTLLGGLIQIPAWVRESRQPWGGVDDSGARAAGLSARDRKSLPPDLADRAPWISYPLAEEDWALFEAAGWKTAENRAAFERAQAQVEAQVRWWCRDVADDGEMGLWAWSCSCGSGSGHGFPDEQAAMLSAQAHLTRDHRR